MRQVDGHAAGTRKSASLWPFLAVAIMLSTLSFAGPARALDFRDFPFAGIEVLQSKLKFPALVEKLEKAVVANGLVVVTRFSASADAANHGVSIRGNLVLGVFRDDYAEQVLKASVPAGIEVPLRFYVTENDDGTATLSYREPSAVFAPYVNTKLDALGRALDPVFAKIAKDATGD